MEEPRRFLRAPFEDLAGGRRQGGSAAHIATLRFYIIRAPNLKTRHGDYPKLLLRIMRPRLTSSIPIPHLSLCG